MRDRSFLCCGSSRKPRRLVWGAVCALCLCFVCLWTPLANAVEAGRVVSMTPGAFVERSGATLPLSVQSVVEAGDILSTDASGRLRVLFADDSAISMGGNTSLSLRDFVFPGSKPSVGVHLSKGLLRAITGKIVEMNPAGFALTTPEATVGIRGTIISVRSERGLTTVYVENTTRKVFVNNVNVPGGQKITIPGDRLVPEPITPQDRRELGRDLAFRGGAGVAAAAPEPSQAAGTAGDRPPSLDTGATYLASDDSLGVPDTALGGLPLPTQSLGDTLVAGSSGGSLNAVVRGSIVSASGFDVPSHSGFEFSVNLSTGAVSNALLRGRDNFGTGFSATSNTGTISGGNLSITGFTGTAYSGGAPFPDPITGGYMTGTGNVNSVGGAVSGNYELNAPPGWNPVDTGSFSGSRIK